MKKIWSLLVMAIVAVQFAFAGDVITKDINHLRHVISLISTLPVLRFRTLRLIVK